MLTGDRYFDVEVEWAKSDPEDLVALVTVTNRGPADAPLDVLATIWFRNTGAPEPIVELPVLAADGPGRIVATHAGFGQRTLSVDASAECLFTENKTNARRLFSGNNRTPYGPGSPGEILVGYRCPAFIAEPVSAGDQPLAVPRAMCPIDALAMPSISRSRMMSTSNSANERGC